MKIVTLIIVFCFSAAFCNSQILMKHRFNSKEVYFKKKERQILKLQIKGEPGKIKALLDSVSPISIFILNPELPTYPIEVKFSEIEKIKFRKDIKHIRNQLLANALLGLVFGIVAYISLENESGTLILAGTSLVLITAVPVNYPSKSYFNTQKYQLIYQP